MMAQDNKILVADYYASLSKNQQKMFRDTVQHSSDLNYQQFVYRMKKNAWSLLELKAIKHIAKRYFHDDVELF